MTTLRLRLLPLLLLLVLAGLGPASTSLAHSDREPVPGKKLLIRTVGDPATHRFSFTSAPSPALVPGHDPAAEGSAVLVRGSGPAGGSTGVIGLDPAKWRPIRHWKKGVIGYRYSDPAGSAGGITSVILQKGRLRIRARGKNWRFAPTGAQDAVTVWFRVEEEWVCSTFGPETGALVVRNAPGLVLARDAAAPPECPEQVCGNGIHEVGEECDDGNLEDGDACSNTCTVNRCQTVDFDSTFDAIQSVIFEGYGCTNRFCHGDSGSVPGLDLRAGAAYDSLVGVPATASPGLVRVLPNEPDGSFLYHKLAAKTLGTPLSGGSPMPVGPQELTPEHLRALELWIRAGAPRDGAVIDTAELLGTCLPDPVPAQVPVPEPPPRGQGVQFRMTGWSLPANSENEICQATYYDFYGLGIVPPEAVIDCPPEYQQRRVCIVDGRTCATDADCPQGACRLMNAINPEGKCFAIRRQIHIQDAQSHHALVHVYTGSYGVTDPGWGAWTEKHREVDHPDNGRPCDPTDIDPALGFNPNCSGESIPDVGCITYGAPDFGNLGNLFGTGGASKLVIVSQEAFYDQLYPEGVYDVMPMRGLMVWNSHAFNLTPFDTRMNGYLNMEFHHVEPGNRRLREIFDAGGIFAPSVPPFETREICRTWTIPRGGSLFRLSSHFHKRGVLFRIWGPPNERCNAPCPVPGSLLCSFQDPGLPVCAGPPEDRDPIYVNTDYADAEQLYFDPPVPHPQADVASRTYLYCALYDNGSTPSSPPVKRRSTSPRAPGALGLLVGGPCGDRTVACANDGPMRGELCGGDDRVCDSAPGALDGECDACPVTGGLTSDDEMFILLGNWF